MAAPIALAHLEEMVLATSRYLEALTVLTDADLRADSELPAWSRAHVVTHLSRNADALCNVLHAAEAGGETPMYESQEKRDADIDEGASRPAAELLADASASAGRLLQAVNELDVRHEDAQVSRVPGGPTFPVREVPRMRRIEVEVHHADLGIGYGPAQWPEDFTDLLMHQAQNARADGPSMVLSQTDGGGLWKIGEGQGPEISGTKADLVWWLIGRGSGRGLRSSIDELPRLTKWR